MVMNKYLQRVINHPKTSLAVLAVFTIILGAGIPRLKFDNSYDVMMPQADEEYLYNKSVKDTYGNLDNFVVIDVTAPEIWTPQFMRSFDALVTDLEEFQTYDETREAARLEKFDTLAAKGAQNARALCDAFADDPAFRRTLERELLRDRSKAGSLDFSKVNNLRLKLQQKVAANAGQPAPTEDLLAARTLSVKEIAGLRARLEYLQQLKSEQQVEDILCPFTARDMVGTKDELRTVDMIEKDSNGQRVVPVNRKQMDELKKRLTHNPAYKSGIYSVDKKTGAIDGFAIRLRFGNIKEQDPISREIWNITMADHDNGITVVSQGVPIINKYLNDYLHSDLISFLPPVFLVIVLVFFLNFRSARGVLLPLSTIVLTDIWVLGLMGYTGTRLTMLGVSLPALMVAVGSSYSIHLLNQYYNDYDLITSQDLKTGLLGSMSHISVTVLLAGLTTFLGFFSLLSNQVSAIREWGVFSALGVMFAVIISCTLIPAAMSMLPSKDTRRKSVREGKKGIVDRFVGLCTWLSLHHYRAVVAVVLLLVIGAIAGALRMNVETSVLSYFKKDDYIRQSNTYISQRLGGTAGTTIVLDSGRPEGVKDPEFLRLVDETRAWLELPENRNKLAVGRTDSFSDVIKTMHRAMNNDKAQFYAIPDKATDIYDYLELYSGDDDNFDGRYDDFEVYVDPAWQKALIFATHCETDRGVLDTSGFAEVQRLINNWLGEHIHEPYSFRLTGIPAIIVRLSDYVVDGQLKSLAFSLLTVVLVVIFLFRNWRAGLLSIVPMGTAIIFNFGIMGWTGINLDYATSIIASIVIGIGVDDTIHFLNTYRHYRPQSDSIDQTLERTLSVTGKAIIYTSLALIFGFAVFTISNFVPLIYFGVLCATTMIFTTLGALLVLPSIIKLTGVQLVGAESESRFWQVVNLSRWFEYEDMRQQVAHGSVAIRDRIRKIQETQLTRVKNGVSSVKKQLQKKPASDAQIKEKGKPDATPKAAKKTAVKSRAAGAPKKTEPKAATAKKSTATKGTSRKQNGTSTDGSAVRPAGKTVKKATTKKKGE